MFSHPATYHGGPKDGHHNTIPSDNPEPPRTLYVAANILPGGDIKFDRARYERQPDGHYEYAGLTK